MEMLISPEMNKTNSRGTDLAMKGMSAETRLTNLSDSDLRVEESA
jgi:hypothetical protein